MSKKVIIIEDSEGVLFPLVKRLKKEGVEVLGILPKYNFKMEYVFDDNIPLFEQGLIVVVSKVEDLSALLDAKVDSETVLLLDHSLEFGVDGADIAEYIKKKRLRTTLISISSQCWSKDRDLYEDRISFKDSFNGPNKEKREIFLKHLKKYL